MNTETTKIAVELLAALNNGSNLEIDGSWVRVTLAHDEYDSLKELLSALLLGVDE